MINCRSKSDNVFTPFFDSKRLKSNQFPIVYPKNYPPLGCRQLALYRIAIEQLKESGKSLSNENYESYKSPELIRYEELNMICAKHPKWKLLIIDEDDEQEIESEEIKNLKIEKSMFIKICAIAMAHAETIRFGKLRKLDEPNITIEKLVGFPVSPELLMETKIYFPQFF
jgi:hypothetical protein